MADITLADVQRDHRRSECGRYVAGGHLAAVAREHLWRDVVGFIAFHAFMLIPTWLPFRWFHWMLPTVGDWSERDARWEYALVEDVSDKEQDV